MATFSKLKFGCLALLLLLGAGAMLSACNTVHGMGEDLQNTSDTVKKAL
jgi:predicted small secreted protein